MRPPSHAWGSRLGAADVMMIWGLMRAHLCLYNSPLTGGLSVGHLRSSPCLGVLYPAGHQRRRCHHISLRQDVHNAARQPPWLAMPPTRCVRFRVGGGGDGGGDAAPLFLVGSRRATGTARSWRTSACDGYVEWRTLCIANDCIAARVCGRTGVPTGEKSPIVEVEAEVEARSSAASSEGTRSNAILVRTTVPEVRSRHATKVWSSGVWEGSCVSSGPVQPNQEVRYPAERGDVFA